jgi:hypothetical protein
MERSTKAFAVLAAVALALAPATNGVVREAAKTAERVFLETADYEPPEDPPEDPPQPPPNASGNRSIEAAGQRPSCNLTSVPAAGFSLGSLTEDPDRNAESNTRAFDVNASVLAVRVGLVVENLTGELDARVYHEDEGRDNAWFQQTNRSLTGDLTVEESSCLSRPDLHNGTHEMQINHQEIDYDRLDFVAFHVVCEGSQQ